MSLELVTLLVQVALAVIVVGTTLLIARMNRTTRMYTTLMTNDLLDAYRNLLDRVRELERQHDAGDG